MDLVALFYQRVDGAKGKQGVVSFLADNGVERALQVATDINNRRTKRKMPSASTLIALEWLFSEEEMIALLEAKLRTRNISDKAERLIASYFKTQLSAEGRERLTLYRRTVKRYWLEQAILKEGIG